MSSKTLREEKEERAARLRLARETAGYKGPTTPARKMGINVETAKAHESGRNGFNISDARKYAKLYEVNLEWLHLGEGEMRKPGWKLVFDPHDIPERPRPPKPRNHLAEYYGYPDQEPGLPVEGITAAGKWFERDDLQQEPSEHLPVGKDPTYGDRKQYALKVEGDSMNRVLLDGEYALCVDLYGESAREGDLVIAVQRRDGIYERTIKRLRTIQGVPHLVPESTNDRWVPVPFDPEKFEVEALVIGKYGRLDRSRV